MKLLFALALMFGPPWLFSSIFGFVSDGVGLVLAVGWMVAVICILNWMNQKWGW